MRLREVEEAAFECFNNLRYKKDVTSLAGADVQAQVGIGLAILALAKAIDRWAQAKERELESKGRPNPGGEKEWTHRNG